MALDLLTSWNSEITSELDIAQATITLRAHREGTVQATAGETVERVRAFLRLEGSAFPDNTSMRCTRVNVKNRGPVLFDWRADYEFRTPEQATGNNGGLPPGWSFEGSDQKTNQAVDQDYNGNAIMTVTRESPNPPISVPISDTAWVFSTTSSRPWNESILILFQNAIDTGGFMGTSAGQCKIDKITRRVSRTGQEQPVMDVSVTVLVAHAPPPNGMYEPNGSGGWTSIQRAPAWYTWWIRWRAEGMLYIPGGTSDPIPVAGPGEPAMPRLHHPQTGILITTASQAKWYVQQPPKTPMLPFSALFNSL